MTPSECRTFLKTTDLLKHVNEDLLTQISDGMQEVEIPAGTALIHAGDAGDAVYLVVEGRLSVEREGIRLAMRGPGECMGEFALIDDAPRSTDVVATTDGHLLRWARADFQAALARRPEIAEGIFKILLGKLRETVDIQVSSGLERERWQQDLKRAHEIQMGMLPGQDLMLESLAISGFCRPAADVGGDYYDYQNLDGGRVGIILGDVTGHGFYSGLFVAMAKTCFHLQLERDNNPAQVMSAMNRTVALSIQEAMLMTCCYILIDAHQLTYCNAGHNYPYHYRQRTRALEPLVSTDPVLGLPWYENGFRQEARPWEPGDFLVLYSDGITEAQNTDGDMFGEARLKDVILSRKTTTAIEIKQAILDAHTRHCQGKDQDDDVTLVVAQAL